MLIFNAFGKTIFIILQKISVSICNNEVIEDSMLWILIMSNRYYYIVYSCTISENYTNDMESRPIYTEIIFKPSSHDKLIKLNEFEMNINRCSIINCTLIFNGKLTLWIIFFKSWIYFFQVILNDNFKR